MAITNLSKPYIRLNLMDKEVNDPERPLTQEKISMIKTNRIEHSILMYGLLIFCTNVVIYVILMKMRPKSQNCHYNPKHDNVQNKLSSVMLLFVTHLRAKLLHANCKRIDSMYYTSQVYVFNYISLINMCYFNEKLRKMYRCIMNNIYITLNTGYMYQKMIMIMLLLFLNVKFDIRNVSVSDNEKCRLTYRWVPTGLYYIIPKCQIKIPFFNDSAHSKTFSCLCSFLTAKPRGQNYLGQYMGHTERLIAHGRESTSGMNQNIEDFSVFSHLNRQNNTKKHKNGPKRCRLKRQRGKCSKRLSFPMRIVLKSTFFRGFFQFERSL